MPTRIKDQHELRLYVAGTTPRSLRAVQNIKRICDAELPDHYHLEVVDVYKQPGRLAQDQVVARRSKATDRRFVPGGAGEKGARLDRGLIQMEPSASMSVNIDELHARL